MNQDKIISAKQRAILRRQLIKSKGLNKPDTVYHGYDSKTKTIVKKLAVEIARMHYPVLLRIDWQSETPLCTPPVEPTNKSVSFTLSELQSVWANAQSNADAATASFENHLLEGSKNMATVFAERARTQSRLADKAIQMQIELM